MHDVNTLVALVEVFFFFWCYIQSLALPSLLNSNSFTIKFNPIHIHPILLCNFFSLHNLVYVAVENFDSLN